MAKSKIIVELANSSIDTLTALKRAKVLFSELQNKELLDWITNEITGYSDVQKLPAYRIVQGSLRGSYFKGSIANHMKWTNVSIPIGDMPKDIADELLNVYFTESVDALNSLLENCKDNNKLCKPLPADLFPTIANYNHDPYMMIIAAQVEAGTHHILNIFSIIENRLLDALLLLEKEFGNLDNLDLDISKKTEDEIKSINNQLIVIVLQDQSIRIGDNNKIKDSQIETANNEE